MNPFDERPLPDTLRRRVLRSVRRRGIVRSGPAIRLVLAAATILATAALVGGGFLVGRRWTAGSESSGDRYALLFYEDTAFVRSASGSYASEYAAWADSLGANGVVDLGGELLPSEVTVTAGMASAPDAPPRDTAGRWIGGFLIIRATSRAEALRIAQSSPHLRHRGTIGVRPVAGSESGGIR